MLAISSSVTLRRSRTRSRKRAALASMIPLKISSSSVVGMRKGDPLSLNRPDFVTNIRTPIMSNSSVTLGRRKITPTEPVTVVGCAMILSAARAT